MIPVTVAFFLKQEEKTSWQLDQTGDHLQPEHHWCIYDSGFDHRRNFWPCESEYAGQQQVAEPVFRGLVPGVCTHADGCV